MVQGRNIGFEGETVSSFRVIYCKRLFMKLLYVGDSILPHPSHNHQTLCEILVLANERESSPSKVSCYIHADCHQF